MMKIQTFPVGAIGTNCYLLTDESAKVCALIDPGDNGRFLVEQAKASGCELSMLLLTHGHFDHVTGIPEILEACPGLPVYIHERDYDEAVSGGGFSQGIGPIDSVRYYKEGDTVALGSLSITVLETPGHTPGSVTLSVNGEALFTGDTLFAGSCGRTDFPGGDYNQMLASLARLGRLPGDLKVYPGHEESSTLDRERAVNYYVKEALTRGL